MEGGRFRASRIYGGNRGNDQRDRIRILERTTLRPGREHVHCRRSRKVLGFAAARRLNENTIERSGIIVLESATGKGIGIRVIEKVISSAREVGFRQIVVRIEVLTKGRSAFTRRWALRRLGRQQRVLKAQMLTWVVLEKALQ